MTQTQLDIIKADAARILISYSNGYVDARLNGTSVKELFDHSLRLHYLCGIVEASMLVGSTVYVGNKTIDLQEVIGKIWHYSGRFDVDLSSYSDIVADDGDGGSTGSTPTSINDHYRAGQVAVSVGAGTVTFMLDGVASPLASANYQLTVYVKTTSGYEQRNIVTTRYASGFTYSDILEAGTLHYTAELNT